jgi:hypothetical protein
MQTLRNCLGAALLLALLMPLGAMSQRLKPLGPLIDSMSQGASPLFQEMWKQPEHYGIQIYYTRIDRNSKNRPKLTTYAFQHDSAHWYYPASLVKLPVAMLALEKLRLLHVEGLDKNCAMQSLPGPDCQSECLRDTTSPDGYASIAHYIRKLFVVSDNDAYNRLFEFLGPEHINQRLAAMGYPNARIFNSFSACDGEDGHTSNPIQFVDENGKVVYEQESEHCTTRYANPLGDVKVGKGKYLDNGKYLDEPWDFSHSNALPLWDAHRMLITVIFPDLVNDDMRPRIEKQDYLFLRKYMSTLPSECAYPRYDTTKWKDNWAKYLLWGDVKGELPSNIRIFNKVGMSFGYLCDVAYVADYEKKVEFFLSATVYVNEDEVFNDNKYNYYDMGMPFLGELGRMIYEMECSRKRTYPPKLPTYNWGQPDN